MIRGLKHKETLLKMLNVKGDNMGTVLEVKDIHKSLGGRKIIKGVTFEVKEGEIFGFLGAN